MAIQFRHNRKPKKQSAISYYMLEAVKKRDESKKIDQAETVKKSPDLF